MFFSLVGRVPVCWAESRGLKPRLDHQLSSDGHVIGRWRWAVGLVSFILTHQLEGDVKECVTLFEKSGEYVPLLVWVGEMISNMDWSSSIVRLYMLTSDLTSLVPLQFSHWRQVRKVVTPVIMIMIMTVMMMMMMMIIKMIRRSVNKVKLTVQGVFTWRHGSHIGVPKQWNGGHAAVSNPFRASGTFFICKNFLWFQ